LNIILKSKENNRGQPYERHILRKFSNLINHTLYSLPYGILYKQYFQTLTSLVQMSWTDER